MILTFDELKELLTFAIIGLAFVLMYRSVPVGFVDKFRDAVGNAAAKTTTPLDDTLLSLVDNIRLLIASTEQLKAASDKAVQAELTASTEIAPQEERPRD